MTNIGICNVNEPANALMEQYAQLVAAEALAETNLRMHLARLEEALQVVIRCQDDRDEIRQQGEKKRQEFFAAVNDQFAAAAPCPDAINDLVRQAREWIAESR